MNDFISQQTLITFFSVTTGLVSLLQILEYFQTKKVPWLPRLLMSQWKKIMRRFKGNIPDSQEYLILNFSGHPVLPDQITTINTKQEWPSSQVIDVQVGTIDEDKRFVANILKVIERIDLSPMQWQTANIVVISAGYSAIWSVLLACMHGRLGYFPDVVHLRPAPASAKEKFEVAEIMNLREVRHSSRGKR
jgi:hypothetical protein